MRQFEVVFFESTNGRQPAKEFLLSLDVKMRAKMMSIITVSQDIGPELREPYPKHVVDGIFELRAKVGSNTTRIMYFFFTGKCIVLTNGFRKKTKKTPSREIETAKKYRKAYLESIES